MKHKKKLKELTLKNNFMFGAVMADKENCRLFLEMTLGFSIAKIEICSEKNIIYHPEHKGVRLDIFAKDENSTHYNVEMQMIRKFGLGKRVRYYHSQMDMEMLLEGMEYERLPWAYVIFICDFDPFGEGKYCYTFENRCLVTTQEMGDNSRSLFLSTYGKNEDEVPAGMVKFLKFVKADLEESKKDFEDQFVGRLQKSVERIRESREMEARYMLLEELLRDERKEGRAEGRAEGKADAVLELLGDLGPVPEELRAEIQDEQNQEVLNKYLKLAAHADSIRHFMESMK